MSRPASRSPAGRISAIRATTVTVPLEAPLRHATGAHWGRFVRTIVEVETDAGLTGLGEMGGGGESAEAAFKALESYLLGHDPFDLEALRFKLMNPTASLYNQRTQLHAAIEFACLDLMGQSLGLRVCDLLGGALRESVPFASYLFYRYADGSGAGGEETPEEMAAHAQHLVRKHGFRTHKLKGGVFPPSHDCEVLRAVSEAYPDHRVRLDPNAVWTVEESIGVARRIRDLPNDYLEDPTWGLDGMRRVRDRIDIPTATNTVVVNFEQLAACIRLDAVDVILLDTTFWGGLRQAAKAAGVCETFQWGVAVHSSGELGIQLATMLHLGALLPNLRFAADAHYHHLTDDVIEGGLMTYVDGEIAVPEATGLGVRLDRERLGRYSDLYHQLGGYHYDRDPHRPDWYPVVPAGLYANPRRR
ncbi:MAG TPA: enolase C-terminal domain-like protein [Actinomycetota bacterium]|nr:enolase C-terminal domain-like protein [Actinomycetota bacterium]